MADTDFSTGLQSANVIGENVDAIGDLFLILASERAKSHAPDGHLA